MTIKQILVPLTGIGNTAHVPAAAFRLARRFDAHVIGCDDAAESLPAMDLTSGMGVGMGNYQELYEATVKVLKERRLSAQQIFEKTRTKAGVSLDGPPPRNSASASWVSIGDAAETVVTNLGRLADLIVVNLPTGETNFADRELLEQVAFTTGRPVLAVPKGSVTELTGRAAVAWNGSIEATRAIAGAMPLLVGMKGIDIIQIGETRGADADSLAVYFTCHGLKARIHRPKDRKGATGKIILETAAAAGCGLMVMGAYTHSPVREMILGGVTNHLFKAAEMPILIAH